MKERKVYLLVLSDDCCVVNVDEETFNFAVDRQMSLFKSWEHCIPEKEDTTRFFEDFPEVKKAYNLRYEVRTNDDFSTYVRTIGYVQVIITEE